METYLARVTLAALLLLCFPTGVFGDGVHVRCYACDNSADVSCVVSTNRTESWQKCDGDLCYALSATAYGIAYYTTYVLTVCKKLTRKLCYRKVYGLLFRWYRPKKSVGEFL